MAEKTIAVNASENGNSGRETTRTQEQYVRPVVDIFETPEGLVVMADLPGASKESVDLEVENEVLTIKARAQHALPGEPIYREFELANYYRQFQLSDTVDDEKIQAEFDVSVEVIDPRTIKPLDIDTIVNSVKKTNRLVVAEESHSFASVGAEISHTVMEHAFDYLDAPVKRVATVEAPIPYAKNLEAMALPDVEKIIAAVKEVCYL